MASILIIDDDLMICDMLSDMVGGMGHTARAMSSIRKGMKEALSGEYDVIFLDVGMPDGNGLNVLPTIFAMSNPPEVIMITGEGDPDGAELAIKNGAWDYIEKATSIEKLTLSLTRALQYRKEKQSAKPTAPLKRDAIIGNSRQMRECLDSLAKAAKSDANILITGETGTGKELFAWAIHDNSLRCGRNFVIVDCAALPETLVESALFGYKKGAFTGAVNAQDGLIKQADGGTLFLDEVGELPMALQKAFLRVLQEHTFRPLGGKKEVRSNFRLVAATNQELDKMVRNGQFRKDLLFRLRSLTIHLAPLRDRCNDIKELIHYLTARLCEKYDIGMKGFSPDLLDAFLAYDWPGNVRELTNAIEGAIAEALHEPILYPCHLPEYIRIHAVRASVSRKPSRKGPTYTGEPETPTKLKEVRERAIAEVEGEYLQHLMSLTDGDINRSCRISGLSRPRLYALLKKYEISAQY